VSTEAKTKRGKQAQEASQSRGLVSRSIKDRSPSDSRVIEVLASVSSVLYPDVDHIEELDAKDQRRLLKFQAELAQEVYSADEVKEMVKGAVRELTDAELDDLEKRRKADISDQKKHRSEDLADQSQRREERRQLLAQQLAERDTKRKDGSRERYVFMGLTSFCVLATILLVCLTAKYAQPWGYAGSATCLALTSVIGVLYRLRVLAGAAPPLLEASRAPRGSL